LDWIRDKTADDGCKWSLGYFKNKYGKLCKYCGGSDR
jgi:hypothetical protein